MLGLGETLARRRGLLRAMKSLRGLEDHYRRIDFSVADQTQPRRITISMHSAASVRHRTPQTLVEKQSAKSVCTADIAAATGANAGA